jgi:hypothetical protein
MSTNEKQLMDASVEVTNFFAETDRKRAEMLAQPEVCSCAAQCTSCFCLPVFIDNADASRRLLQTNLVATLTS